MAMKRTPLLRPTVRSVLKWAWRIAVTALVVYAANRAVSLRDLGAIFGQTDAWALAAVAALGLAGVLLHAHRWRVALASQGIAVSRLTALRTYLWGTALALVTPARLGEFARGLGLPEGRGLTTVVAAGIEKYYLVGAIVAAAGVGWAAQLLGGHAGTAVQQWLGIFWLMCFGAGFAAAAWRGDLPAFPWRPAVILMSMWEGLRAAHARFGGILQLNALAAHLTLILQTTLLLHMLGGGSWRAAVIASCQAYAAMLLLPISIGNMGVREFALSVYWAGTGAPAAGATTSVCLGTSLAILCVNLVVPALAGAAWGAGARARRGTLRPGTGRTVRPVAVETTSLYHQSRASRNGSIY